MIFVIYKTFMLKKLTTLTLIILALVSTFSQDGAVAAADTENKGLYVHIQNFRAREGDRLVADLQNSVGYLINDVTNYYTSFPLMSGQKRNVCYIGRCYFAGTPAQTWHVQEKNIQGDRVTFGPSGEFLRLYNNGKRTAYGIHGYKYFEQEIDKGTKFLSMGCLLVSDSVLDTIEASFLANGGDLEVITTENLMLSAMF